MPSEKIKACVLVVSDRVSRGEAEDRSGREAVALLDPVADVAETAVVADEQEAIRDRLIVWCDQKIDVILTVGGTGLSPRDVTPEATRAAIEREVPAIAAAMLSQGLRSTPRAMLSRAVAGQRGRTLIVNLPGSPSAVREYVEFLRDVLPHAVRMMRGGDHPPN